MKKIALLTTALFLTMAIMAQPKADDLIKVTVEKYDFGKIKQNVPVTYEFELKNITKKPVIVENSYSSCGCTAPGKIEEPILPGKTVKLKVIYNAANPAQFTKDVFIKLAGVDIPKTVTITGEVLAPEAYEEYVKSKAKSN